MAKISSRVLKKSDIRWGQQRTLQYRMDDAEQTPAANAKIVGQEDGQILIQVTCRCGETIRLRCATGQ